MGGCFLCACARSQVLPVPVVGSCPCPWLGLACDCGQVLFVPVVRSCPSPWSALPVPMVGRACTRGQVLPVPMVGATRARGWVLPVPMVRCCPYPWSGPARGWVLPLVGWHQVHVPMIGSARCLALDKTCPLPVARCPLGLVIQVCLGQEPCVCRKGNECTGLWACIYPRAELWGVEEFYVTFCRALVPTFARDRVKVICSHRSLRL